jgi:hypothetical protein
MRNPLLAGFVAAHILFIGGVVLLVGDAITGSWTWGAIVGLAVIGVVALLMAASVRLVRADPDFGRRYTEAWGRALAFGQGGWEPHRSAPTPGRPVNRGTVTETDARTDRSTIIGGDLR